MLLSSHFDDVPRLPTRTIVVSDEQIDTPNSVLFHHPSSNGTSSNCLSQNSPASGCPYNFRSIGTAGSSMPYQDFGHLCRGRRIHRSGHSDFGIFCNLGASIFT